MDTINRMVEKITDAFVQNNINHSTYVANIDHDRFRYIEIRNFLEAASEETIKVFATARTLSKSETLLSKLIRWTLPARITNSQRTEIEKEEQALRGEINSNAEAHRRRIDGITGQR